MKNRDSAMKNKLIIGWVPPALWLLGSLAILSATYRIFVTTEYTRGRIYFAQ